MGTLARGSCYVDDGCLQNPWDAIVDKKEVGLLEILRSRAAPTLERSSPKAIGSARLLNW